VPALTVTAWFEWNPADSDQPPPRRVAAWCDATILEADRRWQEWVGVGHPDAWRVHVESWSEVKRVTTWGPETWDPGRVVTTRVVPYQVVVTAPLPAPLTDLSFKLNGADMIEAQRRLAVAGAAVTTRSTESLIREVQDYRGHDYPWHGVVTGPVEAMRAELTQREHIPSSGQRRRQRREAAAAARGNGKRADR
jgi:hypothetical protein